MAIQFSVAFADCGKILAAFQNLNCFAGAGTPVNGYGFTVTAITTAPAIGAVYSNNGYNYTVIATVKAVGTSVAMVGAGAPLASGTLTKVSGTGDATLTFSAVTAYSNPIGVTVSSTTTAPTTGATYTNNGFTYTVIADVVATGTLVALSGNGLPNVNATLTKVSGTGDSTMTVSAISYSYPNWAWDKAAPSATVGLAVGTPVKTANQMISDILTRLQGVGLTSLISSNNWQTTMAAIDSSLQSQKSALQTLLQNVIIQRVNNDVPQQNPSSFQQAMVEWIRQMQVATTNKVTASTLGSTLTAGGSNTTNGATPYLSTIDQNGLNLDYSLPETMVLECTADQNSGATAGSETVTISSPASVSGLSYLYPGGSGINTNITVVDPTQGYGGGQNLVGGGSASFGAFKAWTGSIPNGWTIDVGGALISDGTSSNYSGLAHCLLVTGDGATQFGLYQPFANGGVSTGSSVTILPNTVYHLYVRVKTTSVPAAGNIIFSLVNGSNAVINDNAGNANTLTTDISSGGTNTTAWQALTYSFRTPTNLPSNVRLRVYSSTALSGGGKTLLVDFLALAQPATQAYGGLYAGGPFMSIFRGSADIVRFVSPSIGDYWTFQVTNTLMANTATGVVNSPPLPIVSLNPLMNQVLSLSSLGLILPTTGTTLISDGLVS